MVSGNRPNNAIGFICELQLFWVVFSLPQNSEPAVVEGCDRFTPLSSSLFIYFFGGGARWGGVSCVAIEGLEHNERSAYLVQ